MTDSQALFWLSMIAVSGWGPIFFAVWTFSRSKSGETPAEELFGIVRGSMQVLKQWPNLKPVTKLFLVAASFSCGAAVIGLARLGSLLVALTAEHIGGLSWQEAQMPPPLGSWWTLWTVQAVLTVVFYLWLQFKRSP